MPFVEPDMTEMTESIHIRPAGLLHGEAAHHALRCGLALPLAGGAAAFSTAEILHRCAATGEISRRWVAARDLPALAEDRPHLAARLERITASRPSIAGVDLSRPRIMGIVNVTPDSFSDGGRYAAAPSAVAHALALAEGGADILDVGGESTRPGASEVPVEEEIARVVPVVRELAQRGLTVSVDTRKAPVMEAAIAAGAAIINDVTALREDPHAAKVVADAGIPVILMHAQEVPVRPDITHAYEDVVLDVADALESHLHNARRAGIPERNIIIDPGLGFGKDTDDNLRLMHRLTLFHGLGAPLLVGASRKRFIGAVTGVDTPAERLAGSLAVAQLAAQAAAAILRVHDVAETAQMVRMLLSAW